MPKGLVPAGLGDDKVLLAGLGDSKVGFVGLGDVLRRANLVK